MIEQMRAQTGRPHWLFLDEDHHLMPSERPPGSSQPTLADCIMLTVDPHSMDPAMLESVDVLLATDSESLRKFIEVAGLQTPRIDEPEPGEIIVWARADGSEPILMKPQKSSARRLRHRRKYAEGELPEDRSFYFRGADLKLNLRAQNLEMFLQLAEGIDDGTWLHHLQQGDYSRWIRSALKDTELAEEVDLAEKSTSRDPKRSRERIKAAIERRYTAPA